MAGTLNEKFSDDHPKSLLLKPCLTSSSVSLSMKLK